jgi:hypothetical protein
MSGTTGKTELRLGASLLFVVTLSACGNCPGTNPPQVTSVGKSVTTLQLTSTMTGCAGTAPRQLPVEPQDWWNAMPAANRQYPFAGWETFQAGVGGCAQTRVDAYRAVVTFNLASVSQLKGLVTSAELVVQTRAMPSGVGTTLNAGPLGVAGSVNLFCAASMGGIGGLVRFGPNDPVPTTSPTGNFEMLGASPFPAGGGTVYTLPTSFVAGPVAGATHPTTASLTGSGGSVYTTDVTTSVSTALNGNHPGISWMVFGNFEGPLPAALTVSAGTDCRTPIDFDLRVTHR